MQEKYFISLLIVTFTLTGFAFFRISENRKNYYSELYVLRGELLNLNDTISAQKSRINNLTSQLDIIDSTVQFEDKLKARVQKIRDLIKDYNNSVVNRNTIALEIVLNSEKYDIESALLLAIIRQESAFNIKAVSSAGAEGLMQVLPSTGKDIKGWLNKSYYNPFKISHNIEFGAYYISKLIHEYKYELNQAVMAYNAGPEAVRRFLAGEIKKLPDETINYEKKVMSYYEYYKEMGIM